MSNVQQSAAMGDGTVWDSAGPADGATGRGVGAGRFAGRGGRGRMGRGAGRFTQMVPGRGGRGRMMRGGRGGGRGGERGGREMMARGSGYGNGYRGGGQEGFGRGRGRMQARGPRGQTPNGRGPARCMQNFGGRGGRGRMGRGGRSTGMGPPSKLDIFNRFLCYKIFSCLTREEQETVGVVYPRFKPAPLTQQQQMMMMRKKMMEERKKEFDAHKVSGDENNEEKKEERSETTVEDDHKQDNSTEPIRTNGEEMDTVKETAKQDTDVSKEESKVIEETDYCTKNEEIAGKSEVDCNVDNNQLELKADAQTNDYNMCTQYESQCIKDNTTKDTVDAKEKDILEETEDESDDICLLTIDADETIPPPDPDCECENCITALSTKDTCNCESCRTSRIKAIQACDCERCRALRKRLTRVFSLSEQECNCKSCRAKKLDPEKKAEMMKKREEAMRINLNDCNTLLAELNTKRLYRRIKHFKRKDKNYDVNKAYPFDRTTEEIADIEWGELLEDYKLRRTDLFPGYTRGSKEEGSDDEDSDDEDSDDESDSSIDIDKEYEYVGDKPSKYELLMFTPCPRAVAVLASYPRSGNSLMRNLYEKITLRVTGSDMMGGLQKHDLVGEMATGTKNVQFVKTHYPERMGAPAFPVSRAVLLVRNPYDAMDSYFNLMSTNSHTTSLSKEERKKHAKIFAEMAMKEVLVWRDFHEFWLKQKIPLLVVRYEDLIRYTPQVIGKVVKFVLEVNSMTFFEDRIHRAIGEEEIGKLGPYKARSGGIGKSLTNGHYSAQLLHHINYGIMDTMEKFGYKEMVIPKPSEWKLEPLDQLGVFIPGTSDDPMIINHKGLVRGPKRHTNWRQVKEQIADNGKKESPKKVSLL